MASGHGTHIQSNSTDFDPFEKEHQLREESSKWDVSDIATASPKDIPVIDLTEYFSTGSDQSLTEVAVQLKIACEQVGFFSIVGHQVAADQISTMFEMVRAFHQLDLRTKNSILMDRQDWPVGGVGYLPVKNRKLPTRDRGNLNEAFILKCDHLRSLEDNQWPDAAALPGFRQVVEQYATTLERLGKKLLPIYAVALDMPKTFFYEAFVKPLYRLRMTHYPPISPTSKDEFGIAPHVDTTFCTILAQDQPGLSIFSVRRQKWIQAPVLKDAFIVNSGELLKQWTNDRFISVKHFANNNTGTISRYSIPFFFNANPDYTMTCVPSCCGPDHPPKYPPLSYSESQAIAQGE